MLELVWKNKGERIISGEESMFCLCFLINLKEE